MVLTSLPAEALLVVFSYLDFFEMLPCQVRQMGKHVYQIVQHEQYWQAMYKNSLALPFKTHATYRESFIHHFDTNGCTIRCLDFENYFFANIQRFSGANAQNTGQDALRQLRDEIMQVNPQVVYSLEFVRKRANAMFARFVDYLDQMVPTVFRKDDFQYVLPFVAMQDQYSFSPIYTMFGMAIPATQIYDMQYFANRDACLQNLTAMMGNKTGVAMTFYNHINPAFTNCKHWLLRCLLVCQRVKIVEITTMTESNLLSRINPFKSPQVTFTAHNKKVQFQSVATPHMFNMTLQAQHSNVYIPTLPNLVFNQKKFYTVPETEVTAFWEWVVAAKHDSDLYDKVFSANKLNQFVQNL